MQTTTKFPKFFTSSFGTEFSQDPSFYEDNHSGFLKSNIDREIPTPIVWYGLSVVESIDFQLKVFKLCGVKAFLSNVYDLLFQDKTGKRAAIIQELVNQGLYHKMDSGGFQLMKNDIMHKKNPVNLTPEIVFKKQCEVGCDLAIQLDNPLSPFLTKDQQYATIDKTIRNFEILLDLNEKAGRKLTIMPVAHGYCDEMIEYCVQKYEDMLGTIPLIGIGSLVPMVKSIKGTKEIGGKWKFIDNLIYLRRRLPNSLIHAFGIGGTMTYLAFFCGVDSLDSNGWVQKSGYGVIQLPGVSDRFLIKKQHNRPFLMNNRKCRGSTKIINEIDLFMACNCPICSQFHNHSDSQAAWNKKVELFDATGESGRLTRAVHNVSVFNNELELLANSIKTGNLDEFVESRLFTTNYYNLYQYAKCLKNHDLKHAHAIKNNGAIKYNTMDSYFH